MHSLTLRVVTPLLAMACVTVAGCGAASGSPSAAPVTPAPAPSPTPTPSGFIVISIHDSAGDATCPPGTASDAQCFTLAGAGSSPQAGAVSVAPVLDVEYPASPPCNTTHAFDEVLTLPNGTLTVHVTAPYLCIGATTATQRTFTVSAGTGAFAGATGSGTISFQTQAVGALEEWQGVVQR